MAATSRLARFISEACPPQFVSVMRRRTPKALDTISEEEHREALASTSALKIDRFTVCSPLSPMAASPPSPATSASVNSKYFLDKVPLRPFSIFEHWDWGVFYSLSIFSLNNPQILCFLFAADRTDGRSDCRRSRDGGSLVLCNLMLNYAGFCAKFK